MPKPSPKKPLRPLPKAEASYAVDPLSDLVSAQELRVWRRNSTTAKILRYLTRWRDQLKEHMAEGATLAPTAEATAVLTTEASSKAQILKDLLTLEPKDIAQFYGLEEPKDEDKPKEK